MHLGNGWVDVNELIQCQIKIIDKWIRERSFEVTYRVTIRQCFFVSTACVYICRSIISWRPMY